MNVERGTISAEERGMAAITHLSGLAGYIIPLGGMLIPIVIWVVKSDSRVISSIAKQALILNVVAFVVGLALFAVFLTVILIPVAILGWILLAIVAVVLPVVGAIKASDGRYFRYPIVGVDP